MSPTYMLGFSASILISVAIILFGAPFLPPLRPFAFPLLISLVTLAFLMQLSIDTLHIICHYLPLGLVGYIVSIMGFTCCFRCFKTLGESLTTVGILELVVRCLIFPNQCIFGGSNDMMSLLWALLHYCNLKGSFVNIYHDKFSINDRILFEVQWSFFLCLRALLSLQYWIGVLFKGRKSMLSSWIVVSILTDIGVIGNMIYMCLVAHDFLHSIEAPFWISNAVFLIIFRICILIIASIGLIQMMKNSSYRDYQLPRSNSVSSAVDPIGSGFGEFMSYWKELPGSAVVVLLTVEIMWNVLQLGIRTVTEIVFGLQLLTVGYTFMGADLYLFGEETVMRAVRVFWALIGIILVRKQKPIGMRFWICFYALLFLASNAILGFSLYSVNEWPSLEKLIFYPLYISADNLFRIFVLYFAMRFTIIHRREIAAKSRS